MTSGFHTSIEADEQLKRTGTIWTALAHVITGVIGAGVLSLAWSTAQLGWVGGPLAIVVFAVVTQISILLVCDCYKTPDPEIGPTRIHSFMEAAGFYLGRKKQTVFGIFLMESFFGCGIAFTIVTASSVKAILRSNCYHMKGHEADCHYGDKTFMLIFGLTQVVVSQIPDFHDMAWLSAIASLMSFAYAFIGIGLGFATVVENKHIKGSLRGNEAHSTPQKVWLIFQALGDIAFAYPYTQIVLEIQDTLRSPPPENKTMKRVSVLAILIITFFYMGCGMFGYAAFGSHTPGNLLTGVGFYEPYWLIDFANVCIIVHLIGEYQVYSQPVFAFFENWLVKKYPGNTFVSKFYTLDLIILPPFRVNLLRLSFRTAYVVSTTGIAMIFPYFNQVLGVFGALNFWPVSVYLPVEMYLVQTKTVPWTRKWILYQTYSVFCLVLSILGLIGSVQGLMRAKFG